MTAPDESSRDDVSLALPDDRPLICIDDFVLRVTSTERGVIAATDVTGSAGVLLAARLAMRVSSPVLYVVADFESAVAALADARFFFRHFHLSAQGREPARAMLPSEEGPYSQVHPDRQVQLAQMASLGRLAQADPPCLFIVPATALARRVVPKRLVLDATCHLRVHQTIDRETTTNQWSYSGYLRVPVVEDPGTYAVRGGIVDVWSPDAAMPIRLELEGDTLVRIRCFNPEDQCTREEHDGCSIVPARPSISSPTVDARVRDAVRGLCDSINWPSSRARRLADEVASSRAFFGSQGFLPAYCELVPLLDYFRSDSCVVFEDTSGCLAAYRREFEQLQAAEQAQREQPHFALDAWAVDAAAWDQLLAPYRVVALSRSRQVGKAYAAALGHLENAMADTPSLASKEVGDLCKVDASLSPNRGHVAGLERLVNQIHRWQRADCSVVLAARSTSQIDRMSALLEHRGLAVSSTQRHSPTSFSPPLCLTVGQLARGVVLPLERLAFVAEEEIFARRSHVGKGQKRTPKVALLDVQSLNPGDFVVHEEHGIGRYLGLERQQIDGVAVDLIAIEYEGGKLFVPVYRLNQVQKYSAADSQPKLDRLGGLSFAKTKAKVQRRLRQLADELLHLYSERIAVRKAPLSPTDDDYATFEATFPFEETPDQAAAIADVLAELESEKVMDRLVCGDVGFGKTEVALRAAFRMGLAARQAAVLCPTTVLAQQHFLTFRERLSGFGLEVRALSRLVNSAEVTRTLDDHKTWYCQRRRWHPSALVKRRPLQEFRAARSQRGAAVRRFAQGAYQAAQEIRGRAYAQRYADPANAANGARRLARDVGDRNASRRSTTDSHNSLAHGP